MSWDLKRKEIWNPLETRTYRFKKPAMQFFCPLCRTERAISMGHRLSVMNYLQITLVTLMITAALYEWVELRGLLSFFPLWMGFEGIRRMLFSRQVPCPHCGFDASWYKRDVKVARRLVGEFWGDKQSEKDKESGKAPPVPEPTIIEAEEAAQNPYF